MTADVMQTRRELLDELKDLRRRATTIATLLSKEVSTTGNGGARNSLRGTGLPGQRITEETGFLQVLLDTIPNPVFFKDKTGIYCGCNDAFAGQIIGLEKEQIIGRTVFDLNEVIPPDLAESYWQADQQLIENPGVQVYENQVRCADGLRRDYYFSKATYYADGEVGGIVGVMLDITPRKAIEEKLRRSEELLSNVLESMSDGILVLDPSYRVTYWNRAMEEISQTGRDQVVASDQQVWNIFPRLNERGSDELMRRAMAGEAARKEDIRRQLPDGSSGYSCEAYLPLRGEQGQIRGIVGVVRETTERRRLEARLRESEKMEAIGKLAGGIAHDFNNQLAAILGFADLLVMELENDPEIQVHAERIIQAGSRSADLVSQLLAYSRRAQYTPQPVDLHEIIDEVVLLLARSIDKRISIKRELRADHPVTYGDPTLLQSALLNLAINARDAMLHGGELTFRTEIVTLAEGSADAQGLKLRPGRYLNLLVSDTGIGMDEETRKHAFEPFFTTKEPGRGTGMGLAAVYGTVSRHGGAIEFESDPGVGTTCRILLPLIAAAVIKRSDRDETFEQPIRPCRILIADDEELMRQMLTDLLRSLGHQVVALEHGVQALRYYRECWQEVDIVILDLDMPKLNGQETLLAMREINPEVKALLSSGYTADRRLETELKRPEVVLLRKPFRAAELKRRLQELLG